MFKTFEVKGKEYKLRLTTRNAISLEQKLGKHPLSVLMGMEDGTLPATQDICYIIHAGLQGMEHGIKLEDVYDIYDGMVEEGMDYAAILGIIVDVFKSGGFIPEDADVEEVTEDSKNA